MSHRIIIKGPLLYRMQPSRRTRKRKKDMKPKKKTRRISLPHLPPKLNAEPLCAPAQYLDGTRIPNTCQTNQSISQLRQPSWTELESAVPSCQKKETCIVKALQNKFAMQDLDLFAPIQPKEWAHAKMGDDSTFWSSVDIRNVLKQYEKAYPTFYAIPLSFINYDTRLAGGECVSPEVCSFSLEEYKQKGKTDICIIFNTDTYAGEGIHWIFVYINIPKKNIIFFDSVGDSPPPEIGRFVSTIKKQDPDFKYKRICKPHQKLSGECGTYCIFGVLLLLTGKLHVSMDHPVQSWEDRIRFLLHSRLPDKYIWSYRQYYMRPE